MHSSASTTGAHGVSSTTGETNRLTKHTMPGRMLSCKAPANHHQAGCACLPAAAPPVHMCPVPLARVDSALPHSRSQHRHTCRSTCLTAATSSELGLTCTSACKQHTERIITVCKGMPALISVVLPDHSRCWGAVTYQNQQRGPTLTLLSNPAMNNQIPTGRSHLGHKYVVNLVLAPRSICAVCATV